jgi:hypothetical protein
VGAMLLVALLLVVLAAVLVRRHQTPQATSGEPIPSPADKVGASVEAGTRVIAGLEFVLVGDIEPARDANERIIELMPQAGYRHAANRRLHQYGSGLFCKFRMKTNHGEGVYAFIVGDDVKYVGECEDLASRMNNGYGNISPRNCFEGGQSTNCRVNGLVLQAAARGRRITLWFHATDNRKAVEADVLRAVQPPWNRAGIERARALGDSGAASAHVTPSVKKVRVLAPPGEPSSPTRTAAVAAVQVRDRSTVEKPVRLVWSIADEMTAANPAVSRREVISECVRRGVALNTAKTQYSAWRAARGVGRRS